jgi:hypothetical protein
MLFFLHLAVHHHSTKIRHSALFPGYSGRLERQEPSLRYLVLVSGRLPQGLCYRSALSRPVPGTPGTLYVSLVPALCMVHVPRRTRVGYLLTTCTTVPGYELPGNRRRLPVPGTTNFEFWTLAQPHDSERYQVPRHGSKENCRKQECRKMEKSLCATSSAFKLQEYLFLSGYLFHSCAPTQHQKANNANQKQWTHIIIYDRVIGPTIMQTEKSERCLRFSLKQECWTLVECQHCINAAQLIIR